jgi:hypothetical protein
MPITVTNPFNGRQYPGAVILQAVRWYLRYPLDYEHVSELLAERGLEVDASCVWSWVQVYSPELNNRCQPHLKRPRSYSTSYSTFHNRKKSDYFWISPFPISSTARDSVTSADIAYVMVGEAAPKGCSATCGI